MTDESRDLAARYYFSALFSLTAGPPSMSAHGHKHIKRELPFEMEGSLLKGSHPWTVASLCVVAKTV
jgi:hypothetical protein